MSLSDTSGGTRYYLYRPQIEGNKKLGNCHYVQQIGRDVSDGKSKKNEDGKESEAQVKSIALDGPDRLADKEALFLRVSYR